jgi:phage baseplate assembly protein gpV
MSFPLIDRVMLQALCTSKIRGVRLAVVTDNRDGEGNPGYRVKLKFPWLSEQDTTFWARIAVPMAGPGRGTYVLPEIDDQVLVVFEHGDIDRPIVVGGLWSKKQEPVEVNQSGNNNTKLIRSRSGHRIIFDDKKGAEKITIVDSTKKNKIVLDSASKIVKIESDGDIEVKAKANLILHANALKVGTREGVTGRGQSLLVHAQKTFGLKATNGITIGGGNTTINVSNAAATRVSGSGAGELGGAEAESSKDRVGDTAGGGGGARGGSSADGGARVAGGDGRAVAPGAGSGPRDTTDVPIELDEIEIRVVEASGTVVRRLAYELTLPDGTVKTGVSGEDGIIKYTRLSQRGDCKLVFPTITRPRRTGS